MLVSSSWGDLERVAAIEALGGIPGPQATELLIASLAPERGRAARTAALGALVARRAAAAGDSASDAGPASPRLLVERVAALLDDPDLFVRQAAARALGRLGEASAIAALERRRLVEAEGRVVTDIDAALAALRGR
jgi:hypothetical protein